MLLAFPAALNCTGPPFDGAFHSIVQRFVPGVAVLEPARLCCTKLNALSTAPGMS